MSIGKIVVLVLYAVLLVVLVTEAGSTVATVAGWALLVLVATHMVETVLYFRQCQQAPGSLAGNLFQVFLFGILHSMEMKAATSTQAEDQV